MSVSVGSNMDAALSSARRHYLVVPRENLLHLDAMFADPAYQKEQDIETGLAEKAADGEPKSKPGLKRTASRLLRMTLQAHKEEPQKGQLVRPHLLVAADSRNILHEVDCTEWPAGLCSLLVLAIGASFHGNPQAQKQEPHMDNQARLPASPSTSHAC